MRMCEVERKGGMLVLQIYQTQLKRTEWNMKSLNSPVCLSFHDRYMFMHKIIAEKL